MKSHEGWTGSSAYAVYYSPIDILLSFSTPLGTPYGGAIELPLLQSHIPSWYIAWISGVVRARLVIRSSSMIPVNLAVVLPEESALATPMPIALEWARILEWIRD